MSSNGFLYFDKKVQQFLEKHRNDLSYNISIDGTKEMHDKCRRTIDNEPTYDITMKAVQDYNLSHDVNSSKITLSPDNVGLTYKASVDAISLGYKDIFINCIYEQGWTSQHATILYTQLKDFADYLINNDISIYYRFFGENLYDRIDESNNVNWCGGDGSMLCITPNGSLTPCLRYNQSSLGDDQQEYSIGNVDEGIILNDKFKCLRCITRRSQSTDECWNCPIGQGCSWCSAYNYQVFGTPNKRTTFTCEMHKAASLANSYFLHSYYRKENIDKRCKVNCPKEWALNIIDENEYNFLLEWSEYGDKANHIGMS